MGFLRSVLHYARAAWDIIWGLPVDVSHAFEAIWRFAGSIHNLFDNTISIVLRQLHSGHLSLTQLILDAMTDYLNALKRIAHWIWNRQVNPVRLDLIARIRALQRWTARKIAAEHYFAIRLYFLALAYAYRLVSVERSARIAAVNAARAYAATLVKAALATVQRQAADGYNGTLKHRVSVIEKIADGLVNRNPALKIVVSDLIRLVIDAIEIDNPVLRLVIQQALTRIIDSLGIDKVAGSLLSGLIGDLTDSGKARGLQDVTGDIGQRLSRLEGQWADFMAHGGPEIEQAGDQWQAYGSLLTDAALVAFAAQAVAAPAAWAAEVDATAGRVVNDTVGVIASLLKRM